MKMAVLPHHRWHRGLADSQLQQITVPKMSSLEGRNGRGDYLLRSPETLRTTVCSEVACVLRLAYTAGSSHCS